MERNKLIFNYDCSLLEILYEDQTIKEHHCKALPIMGKGSCIISCGKDCPFFENFLEKEKESG